MRLPETWLQIPLSLVAEDIQPGFAQSPGEEDSGTVPQIRTHNVSPDGHITLDGIKHVTPSQGEFEKYSLIPGDVVFNNTNSEEWVGKTAIFREAGTFVFSNHMTRIRARTDIVDPDYLARYLHFLWSCGFSRNRAKRWVSQAAVDVPTLAGFKLLLPTLPEQHRIVQVLQQAEDALHARTGVSALIDELVSAAYSETFGSYFAREDFKNAIRLGAYFSDTQYGVSEALEEGGTHAVLRMNNITTTGWLDLADVKYATLSARNASATGLESGDILFNRTNSKELVGKCAIWRGAEGIFSFASYLVRIRLKPGLLPEYVWATLNSRYGKFWLQNAAKQAVSMANISPTDLARFPLPLPTLEEQARFARLVGEIEMLRASLLEPIAQYQELREILRQAAFSGDLTEAWRAAHPDETEAADRQRREALGKDARRVSVAITESAPPERAAALFRPARAWLVEQLSQFQNSVRLASYEGKGTVVADDTEVLDDFCRLWPLAHEENVKDRARRALEELAALGLIAKVALPNASGRFVTAFRPLREEENTRLADAQRLQIRLAPGRIRISGTFPALTSQVRLTAEHAGTAGTEP